MKDLNYEDLLYFYNENIKFDYKTNILKQITVKTFLDYLLLMNIKVNIKNKSLLTLFYYDFSHVKNYLVEDELKKWCKKQKIAIN